MTNLITSNSYYQGGRLLYQGTLGPFVYNGDLYIVLGYRDVAGSTYALDVWRSTNNGTSWSVQDTSNRPTTTPNSYYYSADYDVSADSLVITHPGGSSPDWEICFSEFDCTTNTWSQTNSLVASCPDIEPTGPYAINYVSSTTVVILAYRSETSMGGDYRHATVYQGRDTTWSTYNADDVAANVNTGAATMTPSVSSSLHHYVWNNGATSYGTTFVRGSGCQLGSKITMGTSAGAIAYYGVAYDDTTNDRVKFGMDAEGSNTHILNKRENSSTGYIEADTSDSAVADNISTDTINDTHIFYDSPTGDLHAVFLKFATTDSTIYHDVNTGSGWGTDTAVVDGSDTINSMHALLYEYNSTLYLGVTYHQFTNTAGLYFEPYQLGAGNQYISGSGAVAVAGSAKLVGTPTTVMPNYDFWDEDSQGGWTTGPPFYDKIDDDPFASGSDYIDSNYVDSFTASDYYAAGYHYPDITPGEAMAGYGRARAQGTLGGDYNDVRLMGAAGGQFVTLANYSVPMFDAAYDDWDNFGHPPGHRINATTRISRILEYSGDWYIVGRKDPKFRRNAGFGSLGIWKSTDSGSSWSLESEMSLSSEFETTNDYAEVNGNTFTSTISSNKIAIAMWAPDGIYYYCYAIGTGWTINKETINNSLYAYQSNYSQFGVEALGNGKVVVIAKVQTDASTYPIHAYVRGSLDSASSWTTVSDTGSSASGGMIATVTANNRVYVADRYGSNGATVRFGMFNESSTWTTWSSAISASFAGDDQIAGFYDGTNVGFYYFNQLGDDHAWTYTTEQATPSWSTVNPLTNEPATTNIICVVKNPSSAIWYALYTVDGAFKSLSYTAAGGWSSTPTTIASGSDINSTYIYFPVKMINSGGQDKLIIAAGSLVFYGAATSVFYALDVSL